MLSIHIKYEKANDFTENFNLWKFLECLSTFMKFEVPSHRSAKLTENEPCVLVRWPFIPPGA